MTARLRTGFSFRSAVGKIDDVLNRLVEIGAEYAPMTDTASTFGWTKWKKAAIKKGLKPVFGVELAVTNSINEKKPSVDYWTFIARDSIVPLHELIALATNQFRYQPLLTREQATGRSDVTVIMGERTHYDEIAPAEHLYVGLSPSLVRGQVNSAIANGHQLVAVSDNRYVNEGDQGFYETVCGRNASTQSYPQWIMSDAEWDLNVKTDEGNRELALNNRNAIFASSTADLVKAEMVHPARPFTLEAMCRMGAEMLGCDLEREEYKARLERELALIASKGYEDYFYLVADICQWARARMIVGPARGSSSGSLVCYLLRITTVDPIPYGLIFERFVDINRSDMPDIDIDFPEHRRAEVFEYVAKKYGREKVARLGTVAMYQPRSALKEAAGAMDIPPWLLNPVMDAIVERSSGDSRALQATEDTLRDTPAGKDFLDKYPEILVATKMEGHPRHCLVGSTELKIGQTNHVLKGKMSIEGLWELFINSPSEDTERLLRLKGIQRMPVLVSLEDVGFCRPNKAKSIWKAGEKECLRLTFENGEFVECTKDHRFIINGSWRECGAALVGDEFLTTRRRNKGDKPRRYGFAKKTDYAPGDGIGQFQKGKAHRFFAHGIGSKVSEFREKMEGHACEGCGEIAALMDVHHKDLKGGRINANDLQLLCKSCHRKIHRLDGKRWKWGTPTSQVKLTSIEEVGLKMTFDIEMIGPANFALGNGIIAHNSGQHAAGIVITEQPINHYVAVDQRTGATMCDKKDAEELNLLKIDALGLTQLSIFEHALDLAGLSKDHLFSVPLDDPAAFKVLNDHKYSGIFQFNGLALQSITDLIDVNHLNDIVAITALARPGPLNSGGTNHWIKVRNGREKETYPHPLFAPQLKETFGVVTYQEQIMNIGREVGGLSWTDITDLRKAMSKSMGEEFFGRYRGKFVAGAVERGVPDEIAAKMFNDMSSFGAWAFNKAHAVAYGLVSYYCCWLKAHYPTEFAAATLTYTDNPETQIKLLRELASEGVEYLAADIDYSTETWTVKKGGNWNHLVGPLNNVLGVGPKMMASIIGARKRGEPIPERARKLLESPKTKIDSLFPIKDAFARLMPDPSTMNIHSKPISVRDVQVNGQEQEVMVFCVAEKITPKDENEDINIAKRNGRRLTGPTAALNLRLADDTDVVFAKINRWDYERIGRQVTDRGRAGKSLYAVKGSVPKDFRMISVKAIRYIGDLEK